LRGCDGGKMDSSLVWGLKRDNDDDDEEHSFIQGGMENDEIVQNGINKI
jgi:hypothetical protein